MTNSPSTQWSGTFVRVHSFSLLASVLPILSLPSEKVFKPMKEVCHMHHILSWWWLSRWTLMPKSLPPMSVSFLLLSVWNIPWYVLIMVDVSVHSEHHLHTTLCWEISLVMYKQCYMRNAQEQVLGRHSEWKKAGSGAHLSWDVFCKKRCYKVYTWPPIPGSTLEDHRK